MVVDIELTLNRFGFSRPAPNKIQLGPVRLAWWRLPKHALSFEINWVEKRTKGTNHEKETVSSRGEQ